MSSTTPASASPSTGSSLPASQVPHPMSRPAMMPKSMGLYADGSYTGSPADAYYGTVQVVAIVRNGKMTDVQFLQHPDNQPNSRYINGQAMPLLTQEAIRAQSAQVDGVSGATFTSQAFVQSLSSALAQAKA
ncbi:FMN-binding protein [Candidatus Kaiserbacteria bacterium]|nr:FMN-binding protein [Candidatus Kaiserbacteria bacterium]